MEDGEDRRGRRWEMEVGDMVMVICMTCNNSPVLSPGISYNTKHFLLIMASQTILKRRCTPPRSSIVT